MMEPIPSPSAEKTALPSAPYRGIESFRFVDAEIFFGRDAEAEKLLRTITIYRGVLLYGDSGVGKSSVINAGLIPLVLEEGFQPERLRIQPRLGQEIIVERISEEDHGHAPYLPSHFVDNDDETRIVLSCDAFMEKLTALRDGPRGQRPLLIFDQFEEFFTLFEAAPQEAAQEEALAAQEALLQAIVELLRDHTIPVKLLFVFREDYLAKLNKLFELYPELLDRYVRLVSLRAETLDVIIRGPFDKFPGHFKKELSPDLAARLSAQIKERSGRGLLNLTEVQIACRRLWQADDPERLFAEKGVDGLLGGFLSDALDSLDEKFRDPAIALLVQLVTESGTRNVVTEGDLLKRIQDEEGISNDQARATLDVLEKQGLVRREPRLDVFVYEIVSEFLVPGIGEMKAERKARAERAKLWQRVKWFVAILALIFLGTWVFILIRNSTNETISRLNKRVEARGDSIAVRDSVIRVRDDSIAVKNSVIRVQKDSIAAQESVIVVRDQDIAAQDSIIGDRDRTVAARDSVISVREDTIAARDSVISVREDSLRMQSELIQKQRDEIAQTFSRLSSQDTLIQELRGGNALKDSSVQMLEDRIALSPPFTNTVGIEFVLISEGTFQMGATNGDDDERPVHRVTISQSFYIGRYEVTQGQWKAVMGNNRSHFTGDNRPIEQVTWSDVQLFIRRLNEREGCSNCYRLPTEAEWEYAARARTTGDYAGDLDAMGWYVANSGRRTHPVGEKAPNAWGLYDMHGNVWEWVEDWYGEYSSEGVTNPQGPETGSYRVTRGGGWYGTAEPARSAYRSYDAPGNRAYYLGFRLVRTAL